MTGVAVPTLDQIRDAQSRIGGTVCRTPLVRLNIDSAGREIYLKLENLQPIGSFKLRGAGNAMRLAGENALARGVYTASAGNMAQGVAWCAREMGVRCSVVVPDHAPRAKCDAVERLGAHIVKISFDDWWRVITDHKFDALDDAMFIHPVCDPRVIAGNGTIGLEIAEDLPDLDAVIVPFGGGGLVAGIGTALRALAPRAKVYAAEVETAAPLAASLTAGRPQAVEYTPSFVDGIGGRSVLDEMWPAVRNLVDDSLVVSLDAVATALRILLEHNHVVAEGAGATPVAAACEGQGIGSKVVCVVSGGNIDIERLLSVTGLCEQKSARESQ